MERFINCGIVIFYWQLLIKGRPTIMVTFVLFILLLLFFYFFVVEIRIKVICHVIEIPLAFIFIVNLRRG